MKKTLWILAGCTACLLVVFLLSPKFAEKQGAISSIGKTLVGADRHQAVIIEGGGRALKAQHNIPVIVRATEYMSTFGSGTRVFREISRIAAEAETECERLEAILDLAARSTTDAGTILALAERACTLEGPEQEQAWQAAFDARLERAEFPSVEAAIAAQESH